MNEERPTFTTEEAIAAVRREAPRLTFGDRIDLVLHKVSESDVCNWLADCRDSEVFGHELDDRWPERNHYHVFIHLCVEDTNFPEYDQEYYVKVRFSLPHLTRGRVISFWPWDQRYE